MADAAGDKRDVIEIVKIGEAVSERSPHLDALAGAQRRQQASHLADDQINHIDGDRMARLVKNGVVESEGPAEKWIAMAGQTNHEELTGTNGAGQLRTVQTNAISLASEQDVFAHLDGGVDERRHVVGLRRRLTTESRRTQRKKEENRKCDGGNYTFFSLTIFCVFFSVFSVTLWLVRKARSRSSSSILRRRLAAP